MSGYPNNANFNPNNNNAMGNGNNFYNNNYNMNQPQQGQYTNNYNNNNNNNNGGYMNSNNNNNNNNVGGGGYPSNPSYNNNTNTNDYNPAGMNPTQSSSHGYNNYNNMNTMNATAGSGTAPAAPNATDENGLRWCWSIYPNTVKKKVKLETAASIPLPDMIIPLACMYTPLQPIPASNLVLGDPVQQQLRCDNCGSFCCRHSPVEQGRSWVCLSCMRRHNLPPNFPPQHPALLHDTVEYILPSPTFNLVQPNLNNNNNSNNNSNPREALSPSDLKHPVFMFVLDTALLPEELEALKESIINAIEYIPPDALVGLCTFSVFAELWELSPSLIPKTFVVRGDKVYTPEEKMTMLQLSEISIARGRFLVPLRECKDYLIQLIRNLRKFNKAVKSSERTPRATGTAIDFSVFLLENLSASVRRALNPANKGLLSIITGGNSNNGPSPITGKVLLFSSGPGTRGPGMVVPTDRSQMMRFHRDIISDDASLYKDAFNFYNGIESRMTAVRACLDVFAMSLDQIGVMEMRNCINNTGGVLINGDVFDIENFRISLERFLERCDLKHSSERNDANNSNGNGEEDYTARAGYGVKFEVITSTDTLVSGLLGLAVADNSPSSIKPRATSPLQVGIANTTRWAVSFLDPGTTFAYVFDTAVLDAPEGPSSVQVNPNKKRFFQFITRYQTAQGQRRIRITSVVQPIAPSSAPPAFYHGNETFDQTCTSAVIARMAVSILEKYPRKWDDTKRWVDQLLVKFVKLYGSYSPNQVESLSLAQCLSLFPSFMFNLRRSEYFMVINISPDETTFKRHWLMRDSVDNCILMIQPTLDSYDFDAPYATAVPLDSSSLRNDNIVLMDAFFNVHIMWGATIYEWIKAEYQKNPDYAHFAELLRAAEDDAQAILASRYPYPRFSRTDANGSEARHIKTRVNPTTTYQNVEQQNPYGNNFGGNMNHNNGNDGDLSAQMIYTDSDSILQFMQSLKKVVVTVETNTGSSIADKFKR